MHLCRMQSALMLHPDVTLEQEPKYQEYGSREQPHRGQNYADFVQTLPHHARQQIQCWWFSQQRHILTVQHARG